jgi:hypothetical protein
LVKKRILHQKNDENVIINPEFNQALDELLAFLE